MTDSSWQAWWDYGLWFAAMIGWSLLTLVVLLVIIAFLLLMDRKVWAAVQMRRGPNVVGPFGLFQSFADLLKFAFKEPIIPAGANKGVFLLAPLATATFALAAWAVIPVNEDGWGKWVISDLNVGVLYLLALSSLAVYGIIMGGWASNSKYPFMGSLRSAAQMVSYEVSIGFVIITVILVRRLAQPHRHRQCAEDRHRHPRRPAGLGARLVLAGAVADVRHLLRFGSGRDQSPPFDLVEAESELVAGFMVEYSSTPYLLFMLGEYVAIVTMCALATILFLGGWLPPLDVAPFTWVPGVFWFLGKCVFVFFLFAMAKAMVPRYRYDQLMRLGWKVFLPLSLAMVVLVAGILQYTRAA